MKFISEDLSHTGVKGMKWGIRKQRELTPRLHQPKKTEFDSSHIKENKTKKIKTNADGSKTVPAGFVFNRVGQSSLDVNKSGALYVSHGKEDAARYIKSLGPTLLGDLFGTSGKAVQHISVKKSLRMPSDIQTTQETAKCLLKNKALFNEYNKSIYASVVTNDFSKPVTKQDLDNVLLDPSSKHSAKVAYSVSSFLGDPGYVAESKALYSHFREAGYDAIPDLHDTLSGTSKTAMIVINPDKLKVDSSTMITKDMMKSGKKYVKSLGKLKVSDLIA